MTGWWPSWAGFAFGVGRIYLLAQQRGYFKETTLDVYALATAEAYYGRLLALAEQLRREADLTVQVQLDCQALKKQMQKADRSGAKFALILGDEEFQNNQFSVKNLRTGEQYSLSAEQLPALFRENL